MGNKQSFREEFIASLEETVVTLAQKEIIKSRYINIVEDTEWEAAKMRALYIVLTNIITVCGVLIVGFVTFDKATGGNGTKVSEDTASAFMWVIWAMGLALTLANKWLYVFSIPKKYANNTKTLERLKSEGWRFVAMNGRYAEPNASARFDVFVTQVESIKADAVQENPIVFTNDLAAMGANRGITQPSQRGPTQPPQSNEHVIIDVGK